VVNLLSYRYTVAVNKNIFKHLGNKISKKDREKLNGHKAFVLWFTGLSGSGKSSIASELEVALFEKGVRTVLLDGDNLRSGLNEDLGFSAEDRKENIRRAGEVAKLFVEAGSVVLASFISPYEADRQKVRSLFEKDEFIEIFVDCPLEECKKRDPKGLYKKAFDGEIQEFTGVSDSYERPSEPEIVLESGSEEIPALVKKLMLYLDKWII
jgi:adenylylsulfate kinase